MLTVANRKWFIDPIQSPIHDSDRVLVIKAKYPRNAHFEGTVMKVKNYVVEGRRVWWITEDGDYVYGAPVAAKNFRNYNTVVGWEEDGVWFVAERYNRSVDTGLSLMRNMARSDFMVLDTGTGIANRGLSKEFVKGAPWALELMPGAEDSEQVVAAKLALAEQKWAMRWAQAEIIREALDRGWQDDITELHNEGHMLKPVLGAIADGTALVPMTERPEISQAERDRFATLAERGNPGRTNVNPFTPSQVMVPVPIRIAIDSQVFTEESVRAMPGGYVLRDAVQAKLDDYTAVPGTLTMNPVLTSLTV